MVHLTDSELIRNSKNGDMKAFQDLVERYQDKILWIAYQMIGDYEHARDISQEAFIRVYRSLDKFNFTSNFYTWLYRIVINLCIDFFRKQKPTHNSVSLSNIGAVQDKGDSVVKTIERKELKEEINEVLKLLPVKYKVVLVLRDIEGFSCKEIEQIVGYNHNTVRWRLFRARQIFKKEWEKYQSRKNFDLYT
mgnify:CR=1 FL=1